MNTFIFSYAMTLGGQNEYVNSVRLDLKKDHQVMYESLRRNYLY